MRALARRPIASAWEIHRIREDPRERCRPFIVGVSYRLEHEDDPTRIKSPLAHWVALAKVVQPTSSDLPLTKPISQGMGAAGIAALVGGHALERGGLN